MPTKIEEFLKLEATMPAFVIVTINPHTQVATIKTAQGVDPHDALKISSGVDSQGVSLLAWDGFSPFHLSGELSKEALLLLSEKARTEAEIIANPFK